MKVPDQRGLFYANYIKTKNIICLLQKLVKSCKFCFIFKEKSLSCLNHHQKPILNIFSGI